MNKTESNLPDSTPQIQDDLELLDLMMSDLESAPAIYQPGSYWSQRSQLILKYLKTRGLRDLRSVHTDLLTFAKLEHQQLGYNLQLNHVRLLSNKFTRMIPGWRTFMDRLSSMASNFLNQLPHHIAYRVTPYDIQLLTYHLVEKTAQNWQTTPLSSIVTSLAGNPEETFYVDGRPYTMEFLLKFWNYSFAAKSIDFKSISSVVEIGSGLCQQIEIFKKINPNLTILAFDIPPILYLGEQYIKSIFPDDVVSYRETRSLISLENLTPGKIYLLPNWKFEMTQKIEYDLFWNARSFGEMDPDRVSHYLSYISASAKSIYLHQQLIGDGSRPFGGENVYWSQYENALNEHFTLADRSPTMFPWRPSTLQRTYNDFSDEAVWLRKN